MTKFMIHENGAYGNRSCLDVAIEKLGANLFDYDVKDRYIIIEDCDADFAGRLFSKADISFDRTEE